jgi:hypothetical protein
VRFPIYTPKGHVLSPCSSPRAFDTFYAICKRGFHKCIAHKYARTPARTAQSGSALRLPLGTSSKLYLTRNSISHLLDPSMASPPLFDFSTRTGLLFMVESASISAITVAGLLLYIVVCFFPPSLLGQNAEAWVSFLRAVQ